MTKSFREKRQSDKSLYRSKSSGFIPIACHYDANTLLTKSGQLLQIFQINGIAAEKISDKLFDLRHQVRAAISNNIEDDRFAFWLHTIRRRTNLDDLTNYGNKFSANLHDNWQQKNYWRDKFVNTLYVCVIYAGPPEGINELSAFKSAASPKSIINSLDEFLKEASVALTSAVDNIIQSLAEFGAAKLGIYLKNGEYYSSLIALYRQIIHLTEAETLLTTTDISSYLDSQYYAIGNDKIEVISEEDKRFVSIISLKEYQEVSAAALDRFLQLPIEFITTEIFYFVNASYVTTYFNRQYNTLKTSNDLNLIKLKGLDQVMNKNNRFCNQQISIAIIADNIKKLDKQVKQASKELQAIGIVHVKEDINLEQTFWAQLSGNFAYLRRPIPTILGYTAALASLHNFPVGQQYNIWGRAITILRTEKGTPYFMNFHPSKEEGGNTTIYAASSGGKTTITNFLISEASKFNCKILYFSNKNDSKLFIKVLAGNWIEERSKLFNPFIINHSNKEEELAFINKFLQLICNHYTQPLEDNDLAFLSEFALEILAKPKEQRILSKNIVDLAAAASTTIKARLKPFMEGGLYYQIFEGDNNLDFEHPIGFNINFLTKEFFANKFMPSERRLMDQFIQDSIFCSSVRTALIFALNYHFNKVNLGPKIITFDNLDTAFSEEYFSSFLADIFAQASANDAVILSNINFNSYENIDPNIWRIILEATETRIVYPSSVTIDNINVMVDLNKNEVSKLAGLSVQSRMFLIKTKDQSIITELSIASLANIVKILSAREAELKIFEQIITKNKLEKADSEALFNELYQALSEDA